MAYRDSRNYSRSSISMGEVCFPLADPDPHFNTKRLSFLVIDKLFKSTI